MFDSTHHKMSNGKSRIFPFNPSQFKKSVFKQRTAHTIVELKKVFEDPLDLLLNEKKLNLEDELQFSSLTNIFKKHPVSRSPKMIQVIEKYVVQNLKQFETLSKDLP